MRQFIQIVENALVTTSPEFQAWFAGSKVVDEHGNPLLCFHGTDYTPYRGEAPHIEHFLSMTHFGTAAAASHFANRAKDNGHIYPVYLSIKSPVSVKDHGSEPEKQVFAWLKELAERNVISYAEAENFSEETGANDGWYSHLDGVDLFVKLLASKGYDGINYVNTQEDKGHTSWVIFSTNQVWPAFKR